MAPGHETTLELLKQRQAQLLERWRALLLESYPEEAARFFGRAGDAFRNPVGHTLANATEAILDGLLSPGSAGDVTEALEAIVRIRAVQQFSAAEALAFVFLLKRVARETLAGIPLDEATWNALGELDSRVDALALTAFEIYAGCRQRIYEIRLREASRRSAALLQRLAGDGPAPLEVETAG
jgi:hypothetical protein